MRTGPRPSSAPRGLFASGHQARHRFCWPLCFAFLLTLASGSALAATCNDAACPDGGQATTAETKLEGGGFSCTATGGHRSSAAVPVGLVFLFFFLPWLALAGRRAPRRRALARRGRGAGACGLMVGALALSGAPAARADFAIDAIHFHPTLLPGGIVNVDGSATQPIGSAGATVVFSYASQPLLLVNRHTLVQSVAGRAGVQSQALANFGFSLGLVDAITLGIDMPMVLWQDLGDNAVQEALRGGDSLKDPTHAAPGDLRFSLKFRLKDNQLHGLGVALLPMFTVPSGDANSYAGWGVVTFEGRLVLDYRFDNGLLLAANASYFTHQETQADNLRLAHELRYGAGIISPIMPNLSAFLEVYGTIGLRGTDGLTEVTRENSPAEGLMGVRYRHPVGFTLQLGAALGLGNGYGAPASRIFGGFGYEPSFGPRTKQNVNDGTQSSGAEEQGAAVATTTPEVPATATQEVPATATQEVPATATQEVPAIPATPSVPVTPEIQVSPAPPAIPVAPISPGGGGTTGQANLVTLHGWRFEFAEPLTFVPGRAVLVSRSEEIVRALAQFLAERADLRHVLIEGHADEVGQTSAASDTLSRQRAQAVEHILTQQGVAKQRLRTQGFGKSRPLYDPTTPDSHERNSRIEVQILD